jgi:hypothetical protein
LLKEFLFHYQHFFHIAPHRFLLFYIYIPFLFSQANDTDSESSKTVDEEKDTDKKDEKKEDKKEDKKDKKGKAKKAKKEPKKETKVKKDNILRRVLTGEEKKY